MDDDRQFALEVSLDIGQPARLDNYLTRHLSSNFTYLSRTRLQKLIGDGKVIINGQPGKPGLRLHGGEHIEITVPADVALELKGEDIELEIVYQDSELIVINKPTGMVTHPGAGTTTGTLVNALIYHCGDSLSGISGILRPGIVHRLDKDTSGLLVVAKNDLAHQSLAGQIQQKEARREYVALLEGSLPAEQGLIDRPIGRHPVDRKKMSIVENGRQARTYYNLLKHWHKFSLIKAILETGRTHQIRVHMANLNCPVVGDIVYNRKSTGTQEARQRLGLRGHALHAARLSFKHPRTGLLLEFEAPMPDDFRQLLERLDLSGVI